MGAAAALVGGLYGSLLPKVASAAEVQLTEIESGLSNDTDIGEAVGGVINVVLGFLGVVCIILFLYGGFLWMTAAGNEEKVGQAKKIITATVIGLVIVLLSAAAVNFVLTNLIDQTGASIDY